MTQSSQTSQGPCGGIRVLELATTMVSGPLCGQILADLGAEVIKLESLGGDMMRMVAPVKDGVSGQFLQFNRNKRSIAVDLKTPEGREVALELIRSADVLVENFRPGVTARMGLDYETVKALNDRLVYVSINGFGADGPYAKLPAYDQVIQGLVGFMPVQGGDGDPVPIRSVIVDKVTSLSAAAAAMAALLHRERGGGGQHVEVKMLDAYAAFILPELLAAHAFAADPPAPLPPSGIYRTLKTADGRLVGLIVQDSQFRAMCRALDRDDLLEDDRFSDAPKRFLSMTILLEEFEKQTIGLTTAELLERLWAEADIAIAPVNSLEQFLADPQAAHNATVFTIEDPDVGPIRQLGPFARFGATPPPAPVRAPHLGEHSDQILSELELTPERIAELRARGVVG